MATVTQVISSNTFFTLKIKPSFLLKKKLYAVIVEILDFSKNIILIEANKVFFWCHDNSVGCKILRSLLTKDTLPSVSIIAAQKFCSRKIDLNF